MVFLRDIAALVQNTAFVLLPIRVSRYSDGNRPELGQRSLDDGLVGGILLKRDKLPGHGLLFGHVTGACGALA